jgi:hypothetical protein
VTFLTNSALPTCFLALLATGTAHAHALSAQTKLKDGRIELTAYYDDNTPARGARVRLEDGQNQLVTDFPVLGVSALGWMGAAQGQGAFLAASPLLDGCSGLAAGETDKEGRWTCPVPAPGTYVIFIDAGDGHVFRQKIVVPGNRSTSNLVMPRASDSEEVISEGPSRREFTTIHWGRVLLGLGILGGAAVGLWLLVRSRPNMAGPERPSSPDTHP